MPTLHWGVVCCLITCGLTGFCIPIIMTRACNLVAILLLLLVCSQREKRCCQEIITWFIDSLLGRGKARAGGGTDTTLWFYYKATGLIFLGEARYYTEFKHLKREVKESWVRGVRVILSWGSADVVWGGEQEKKGHIVTQFQHLLCIQTEELSLQRDTHREEIGGGGWGEARRELQHGTYINNSQMV